MLYLLCYIIILRIRNEAACSKDPLSSDTLPDYWSWLSLANYDGQREVRHVTYDFWKADVSCQITYHIQFIISCRWVE